jgi:glycerol-3-phosphate acyltransferase PlsY
MTVFYKYAIITFLSYLFGAVPYGYILLRLKTGENILKMGSGNIGSTNVRRVAGKKLSIVTQLLDMSKGLIPVTLFLILKKEGLVNFEYNLVYIIALATITGHNYSIFENSFCKEECKYRNHYRIWSY